MRPKITFQVMAISSSSQSSYHIRSATSWIVASQSTRSKHHFPRHINTLPLIDRPLDLVDLRTWIDRAGFSFWNYSQALKVFSPARPFNLCFEASPAYSQTYFVIIPQRNEKCESSVKLSDRRCGITSYYYLYPLAKY